VGRAHGRVAVLYDSECGFCAWALAWLLRWDRARRPRFGSAPAAACARLLADISEEQRLASWHVCDERGARRSGAAAFAPVLKRLPGGAPLAALTASCPRASEAAYAWVARHRSGLGRLVSGHAKRRSRAVIAARMH